MHGDRKSGYGSSLKSPTRGFRASVDLRDHLLVVMSAHAVLTVEVERVCGSSEKIIKPGLHHSLENSRYSSSKTTKSYSKANFLSIKLLPSQYYNLIISIYHITTHQNTFFNFITMQRTFYSLSQDRRPRIDLRKFY